MLNTIKSMLNIIKSISHDFWCYCTTYTDWCSLPFGWLSSYKACSSSLWTLASIGFIALWEKIYIAIVVHCHSVVLKLLLLSFQLATVPQMSALSQHATPSPQGEGEIQMSMYDCDLVVCSIAHHDCLFSSRSILSLFHSLIRWGTSLSFLSTNTLKYVTWFPRFLLPYLSSLYLKRVEPKQVISIFISFKPRQWPTPFPFLFSWSSSKTSINL